MTVKQFMYHHRGEEWTQHFKICTGYRSDFGLIDLKTGLSWDRDEFWSGKTFPSLEAAREAAMNIIFTKLIDKELEDVAKD